MNTTVPTALQGINPRPKRAYTRRVPRVYRRPAFLVRTNNDNKAVWTCRLDKYGKLIEEDNTEPLIDFSVNKNPVREALGKTDIPELRIVEIIEEQKHDKKIGDLMLKEEEKPFEDAFCFDAFDAFDPIAFEMY